MTAPHQCFDWFRARALEELAIAKRLPQLRELLAKAEQYDPHNAYINYYAAQLITQYTDPAKFSEVRDDVLREIRAGNAKPRGYFFFPPPLRPLYGEAQAVQLFGSETEAKYVDMWYFFGHLDPKIYDQIVMQLLPALSWPADKQDIGELMYMLYNLGRVKPYDRSLFSLQLKILDYYLKQQEAGSPESVKLAAALRYLSEQYRSVANEMYRSKLITDPARLDVMGIQEQEMRGSRQNNLKRMIQGPQAAFLNQAGETLGISFPLPEDPNDW